MKGDLKLTDKGFVMNERTLAIANEAILELGVPPHTVFDCLLPVYLGARKASGFPYNLIGPPVKGGDFDEVLSQVRGSDGYRKLDELSRKHGAEAGVTAETRSRRGDLDCMMYVYRGNGEALDRIDRLFREGHHGAAEDGVSDHYLEAVRETGRFLAYPACCVDAYLPEKAERLAGRDGSEKRASEQIREAGTGLSVPLIIRASYFTSWFVPCEPGCSEASRTGMSMLDALGREDPGLREIYAKGMFPSNMKEIQEMNPLPSVLANNILFMKLTEGTEAMRRNRGKRRKRR